MEHRIQEAWDQTFHIPETVDLGPHKSGTHRDLPFLDILQNPVSFPKL